MTNRRVPHLSALPSEGPGDEELPSDGDPSRMEERARRIVDSAIALAEQGGFDNVRLRDVARKADVALGTLYKRFRSKEAILAAVLELAVEEMEERMVKRPIPGDTPFERVSSFYAMVTRHFCRKQHLARAVLRAVASGTPAAGIVLRFQDRAASLVMIALRGPGTEQYSEKQLRTVATILQDVWFALLVGWNGGLYREPAVIKQMSTTAELLLRGLENDA